MKKRLSPIEDLLRVMARLRSPKGCPWDREQDHMTLRWHAVEEVYELMDAIESRDDHEMAEELGDLLLQVVFHCQLARERGAFDFERSGPEYHGQIDPPSSARVRRSQGEKCGSGLGELGKDQARGKTRDEACASVDIGRDSETFASALAGGEASKKGPERWADFENGGATATGDESQTGTQSL